MGAFATGDSSFIPARNNAAEFAPESAGQKEAGDRLRDSIYAAPCCGSKSAENIHISPVDNSNDNGNDASGSARVKDYFDKVKDARGLSPHIHNFDPTTFPQNLADSLNNINANGVDQDGIGDCVFEASLAALASTPGGKQQIQQMITPADGGGYTVTFPGESQHPVHVTNDDLWLSSVIDAAPWAQLIETAMVKGFPSVASGGNPPPGTPNEADGNPPTPAQYCLQMLTGNDADKVNAQDSIAPSFIQQNLDAGKPVVAFCFDDDKHTLISGHEWSVMNIDGQTGDVTVRNPWGHNDSEPVGATNNGVTNVDNGEMKMPWNVFNQHYEELTTAQPSAG